MSDTVTDRLGKRLDRLEREVRLWRVLGSALLTALGLLVFVGATGTKVADEIRAKRFVLVDGDGKTRAELMMLYGVPTLTLRDSAGWVRVMLGGGLTNKEEEDMLALWAERSDPFLAFYDAHKVERMSLYVKGDDGAGLELYGKIWHRPQIVLEVAQESPVLRLADKVGMPRAVLGHTELKWTRTGSIEQRPASSLVLFGKDGKAIWTAP